MNAARARRKSAMLSVSGWGFFPSIFIFTCEFAFVWPKKIRNEKKNRSKKMEKFLSQQQQREQHTRRQSPARSSRWKTEKFEFTRPVNGRSRKKIYKCEASSVHSACECCCRRRPMPFAIQRIFCWHEKWARGQASTDKMRKKTYTHTHSRDEKWNRRA